MSRFRSECAYLWVLARTNLRAALRQPRAFAMLASFMLVQNLIFFVIWVIFFRNFSEIRGWQLPEVATLVGIAAFGFGSVFFVFGGTLDIARVVSEGGLDPYLGRPKSPLLALMMHDARPAGLGDVATAPILWFLLAGWGISDLPLLLLLSMLSGIVVLSTAIMLQSLAFFIGPMRGMADQLFEFFIILSLWPQTGFALPFKVMLFTVVPAGFVAFLPVETMRALGGVGIAAMAVGAAVYLGIAVLMFHIGLGRYTSANRFVDLR